LVWNFSIETTIYDAYISYFKKCLNYFIFIFKNKTNKKNYNLINYAKELLSYYRKLGDKVYNYNIIKNNIEYIYKQIDVADGILSYINSQKYENIHKYELYKNKDINIILNQYNIIYNHSYINSKYAIKINNDYYF
jgi:hypothetical protein